MKREIELQKVQMQLALNWLSIIEVCNENLATGTDTEYYRSCKQQATEGYSTAMCSIMASIINCSSQKIAQ